MPALSLVFDPANGPQLLYGHEVLSAGALDMAALQFGWLANPLIFVALLLLIQRGRPWLARAIAGLLVFCALDSFTLMLWPDFYGYAGAHAGFYVWLAACAAAAAALLWFSFKTKDFVQ